MAGEIHPSDCSVQFDVEPHDEYPSFQKHISLEVSHPTHGKIASLVALHINRDASRFGGRFLQIMDEDQQELADFSQALFNKYGFLKRHLIDNPHLRGTGVWGREMDSGDLIYIFTITVDEKFRQRGVGSWMLEQFLKSPHVHEDDVLICWPAPLSSDISVTRGRVGDETWTKLHESQIRFFHKNHFRRIGRTQYFGLSPQTDHPSRSIPIDADARALSEEWSDRNHVVAQEHEGLSHWEAQQKDVELRRSRYPLHSAIYELRGEPIAQKIQEAYNENPASIHQRDDHGFTPVFAAASTKNLVALRKLIDLGVSEDLSSRDNADGLTPLEACTQRMISSREFSETLLPRWDGFSREELLCCSAMKRAISPSTMAMDDEEYVLHKKWGCTCGKCLDGWLSPRMKIRLEYEGSIKFDTMDSLRDSIGFVKYEPLAPENFDLALGLDFIPLHLRDKVYKTFYEGYRHAFEAITFVSEQNHIPYPAVVREAMLRGGFRGHDYYAARAIDFYFSKGGIPDFALDCLLDAAEEQSPLGDGEFDLTFNDDLEKLPECANDLEFNLIRQNLGLNLISRGPYRDVRDEEEAGGFDEDSEDDYDVTLND